MAKDRQRFQLGLFGANADGGLAVTTVPERWRALYGLNPMAGVVEGFRWALLGAAPPGPLLAVSAVTVALLLVGGLIYFQKMEATFADVV